MKMLDALDMQLNQLQNFVVQVLAADPANTEARMYYNSVSHTLRFYNGTIWQDLAAATYTDEQAEDAMAAAFSAGSNTVVTVSYNDAGNSFTLGIGAGQVTLAMMANIAAHTYLGNNTAGSTAPIALTKTQLLADLAIAESDVTNLVSDLAAKAPIASPTFTGITTAPEFSASGLTGATAASRYVGATASGAPGSGTFVTGDHVVDQTGTFWVCTASGSPGTWAAVAKDSLTMHLAGTETVTGTKSFSAEVTAPDFKPSGLTGAVSATRYVGGTASVAPTTGTFVTGDWVVTQAGSIFICTAGGSPGTWAQVTGITTGAAGGDLTGTYPNPTLGTNVVTNSKAAQMAANTFKANNTGSTANAADITVTQAKTLLAIVPGDVSGFDTQVRTNRLDQMAAPSASVSLNSQKITSLLDPTAAQDAATKAYVDATAAGIDWKASVRVATTANIATLAGGAPSTLDGVTLVANDRILVKDQSTGSQNGIYFVATLGTGANGTWTRAVDADTSAEVTSGVAVFIEEGTVNADSGWMLITNGPITLGTTALVFTQFTGLGQISVTAPIVKTGSTLSLDTTSTTHVTRTWSGALTGGSTSEVVTHNLGTRDIMLQVINNATPWDSVLVTWEATSTNTATIRAGSNLPASYRVVVMG